MGALGFQFLSVEAAVAWVNAYYGAYVHNLDKLADYQTNPNMAMVSALMCSTSDEEARRRSDGWSFFQFALVLYNKEGPFAPGSVDLWQKYLEWRENPDGQQVYSDGLIGTPARICEQLDEFAKAHVDQVILLTQAGKNTHEDICESLELFAKEVMPEFHAREAEQVEWKRKVLAGEIELEQIDTTPFLGPTTQTPVAPTSA
jgi:alkanesulfonate monooxygenase SsuD/methylene tetrahydromethanopterin reductase-like flavin-dependent oxidoreductase (luciferase family)